MRIVIDVKKDHNPQVVLNTLFKQTSLQVNNSIILLALVDGVPRILNLKQILETTSRTRKMSSCAAPASTSKRRRRESTS